LGIPASQLAEAYLQLGCRADSFTCAPYLLYDSNNDNDRDEDEDDNAQQRKKKGQRPAPAIGEHIAWGESNAVVYANSVWGARTLKYADYMDICAALVGRVPAHGVHLDQGRRPGIILDVSALIRQIIEEDDEKMDNKRYPSELDVLFPLLGYVCGKLSMVHVPLIMGMGVFQRHHNSGVTDDNLKAFCAAFGTTGSAPLFHMAGITPEPKDVELAWGRTWQMTRNERNKLENDALIVTMDHMNSEFQTLDSATTRMAASSSADNNPEEIPLPVAVGLVALGNPHLSLSECQTLSSLVSNMTTRGADEDEDIETPMKKPRKVDLDLGSDCVRASGCARIHSTSQRFWNAIY
jgi:predicted aconitase